MRRSTQQAASSSAGGRRPRIAIVQRSKDDRWVLPRGKLKRGEKPTRGARREATEETGHRVRVHEFLGAITYRASGRPKVVQFWRMAVHEPFTQVSGTCPPSATLIGASQRRRKSKPEPFNEHGPDGTTECTNEATFRRRAMRKTLLAIAAAATLVVASVAAPQQAEAGGKGGAIAAGVIGGIAAGALIGGALASQPRYYYYEPAPAYYYRPRCFWARERYWNGWRWRSHRVRVCR